MNHQLPIVENHTAPSSRVWVCPDENATQTLAQRLATRPELAMCIVTLQGDLGAGKTTWVRHLLRALGVQGRVKSPSYAILEPHQAPPHPAWPEGLAVSHFDFYRFSDPREWEDAGFRDVFAVPGLKLVEWPEQASGLLPAVDLALHLTVTEDGARRIEGRAHSRTGLALLELGWA